MDTQRLRTLLDQRDEIDVEIATIVNGIAPKDKTRKPQTCSKCGVEGHSARTCPQKEMTL